MNILTWIYSKLTEQYLNQLPRTWNSNSIELSLSELCMKSSTWGARFGLNLKFALFYNQKSMIGMEKKLK